MADQYLEDGTYDFSLGQDSWHDPQFIQQNQYARGVNISTRSGRAGPRAGYFEVLLEFEDKSLPTKIYNHSRTHKEIFETGRFQARIPVISGSDEYFIVVIAGLIWRVNPTTRKVRLLSETIKVDQFETRINWSFANEYVVLFDYPDYPVLVKGEVVTRADPHYKIGGNPAPQVPVTQIGTYNENRLFVASETSFTAGDPVGNRLTPEAPVTFTEIFTPSSAFVNQQFTLPVGDAAYPITAMGFLQVLDTSTGIGPMFIATAKKLYHYATDKPRAQWDQERFGAVLLESGITGPRAFINVGSDMLFLSRVGEETGLHALSITRGEFKKWGQIASSREVQNYLKYHDPSLARLAVLGAFDNFIFISANPYRVEAMTRDGDKTTDYAHGGFVVLEVESVASLLAQGSPIWDGLWTGVNPTEIGNLGKQCFVFSKDGSRNAIYEVKPKETIDSVRGRKRLIRSILYTREYTCKSPLVLKKEHTIWLNLKKILGKFKVKIERKAGHSHRFLDYAEWSHNTPSSLDTVPSDAFLQGVAAQEMQPIVFGDAAKDGFDPNTGAEYSTFLSVQLRLTIEGEGWSLKEIKIRTKEVTSEETQSEEVCDNFPSEPLPLQFEPDWLMPEETVCP